MQTLQDEAPIEASMDEHPYIGSVSQTILPPLKEEPARPRRGSGSTSRRSSVVQGIGT